MNDVAQSIIFLAAQQQHVETSDYRLSSILQQSGEDITSLLSWNDQALAAGKSISVLMSKDVFLLILPVVGTVICSDSQFNNGEVRVGELLVLPVSANTSISFSNPFEEGVINFFYGVFQNNLLNSVLPGICSFNLDEKSSQLVNINDLPVNVSIGKFLGREEAVLPISSVEKKKFVFVIQGAFEVHHRLLETGDGMLLWNTNFIEMESLSNEAIIIFIDC